LGQLSAVQIRSRRICEVELAAEALDQRHRAALRCVPLDARLVRQPTCDHAMHDPQHRADGFWLAGEQEAQRHRNPGAPADFLDRRVVLGALH